MTTFTTHCYVANDKITLTIPSAEFPWKCKVQDCQNLPQPTRDERFPTNYVGVTEVVDATLSKMMNTICTQTSDADRKSPFVLSSLSRSGKTTILRSLFDTWKKQGKLSMIVRFNGSGPFKFQEGETAKEAIMRQIVSQLVDTTSLPPNALIKCDEASLRKKLQDDLSDSEFILFVDELNASGVPLPYDASSFLKEVFLDPPHRGLVFSTHVPMDLNTDRRSISMRQTLRGCSDRDFEAVKTPICLDIEQLRSISPKCADLTPHEMLLYGGNPALIFCIKHNQFSVIDKFTHQAKKVSTWDAPHLAEFVHSLLTGSPLVRSKVDDDIDPLILLQEQFSFNPENSISTWPIC